MAMDMDLPLVRGSDAKPRFVLSVDSWNLSFRMNLTNAAQFNNILFFFAKILQHSLMQPNHRYDNIENVYD